MLLSVPEQFLQFKQLYYKPIVVDHARWNTSYLRSPTDMNEVSRSPYEGYRRHPQIPE
jgi:hypothetical protein